MEKRYYTENVTVITAANLNDIQDAIIDMETGKVDKITGKGLSTNDYTTAEKNKLSGIAAGAEVNVQANWNETSTSSDAYIKNKPTKLSQFSNDAGFVAQDDIVFPAVPSASTTAPKMNGTAAVGTSTAFSRGDHVHPSDTSKLSKAGDTLTGRITLAGGSIYSNVTEDTMLFDKDGLIFGQGGETSVSVTPSKITVRSAPTADTDVANKAYVDRVAGGTSVADSHIVNLIYPVGSIYMSVNSTSPATLFGGTWTQLQNRFLLGAGSSYANGATGGAATVTLTTDQLPKHNHEGIYYSALAAKNLVTLNSGSVSFHVPWGSPDYAGDYGAGNGSTELMTGNTGGGAAHNNMPPYLVVYMWKRTA